MGPIQNAALYRLWGADKVVYGPLDLPALSQWITEGRVTEETWILLESTNEWTRATEVSELKPVFSQQKQVRNAGSGSLARAESSFGFAPESLRRIKLFANLQ